MTAEKMFSKLHYEEQIEEKAENIINESDFNNLPLEDGFEDDVPMEDFLGGVDALVHPQAANFDIINSINKAISKRGNIKNEQEYREKS